MLHNLYFVLRTVIIAAIHLIGHFQIRNIITYTIAYAKGCKDKENVLGKIKP